MQDDPTAAILEALERRTELEARLAEAQSAVWSACQSAAWSGVSISAIGRAAGVSRQAIQQLVGKATRQDRLVWEESQEGVRESRRLERFDPDHADYGCRRGAFQCPCCKRFKSRPSARCSYCGDEMGTHNGDDHELNRAYGYAA
jgi:hypothetical protein